jgi:RecJ-like exonuclease
MRWLICFTVVFIGCVSTLPSDNTVSADIAAETARLVVQLRNEIKPTPTPDSGDCENCNGTGKVGDGTIMNTCQVCGGTGKK